MLSHKSKVAGFLLLAVICLGVPSLTVFADREDANPLLAGSAALLADYYSGEEAAGEETSPSAEDIQQDTEASAAETQDAKETQTTEEAQAQTTAGEETDGTEAEPEETEAETDGTEAEPEETEAETESTPEETESSTSEEEMEEMLEAARQEALDSYEKLGIVEIESGHLNVRRKPDEESAVIGKMYDRYACEVIKKKGNWYKISSGPVDGYVSADYLLTGKAAEKAALKAMELKVQINTETLNVRTEPSEEASVWTQVDDSDRYDVVENLGDWIEIELDNDSTGFVSSEYVKLRYTLDKAVEVEEAESGSSLRQQIVEYALQFLGNPYVWGGESLTGGCDCSGFTMLIYRHFGVSLSHYSVSQAGEGRRVSESDMKPGDLVFYAKNGTINHVTMYIGNGQVVGAQSRRSGITTRSWTYRTPVKIVNVLD